MKVVVDGVAIDLAPGTSAIDAVFAAGSDVPYFCSQEYLSPIGACRLCLAKVGAPRKERAYPYTLKAHYYSRGPMGYGMGKLEIIEHDGKGGLRFEERPFVIMQDNAFVELGKVGK